MNNFSLTDEETKLLLYIISNYPRNMREPFETNGEFEDHLKQVDELISKLVISTLP